MLLKTFKNAFRTNLLQVAAIALIFSALSCNKKDQKNQTETTTTGTISKGTPSEPRVSNGKGLPAEEGYDASRSDKKALEIADKLVDNLGGYDAWNNTRFVAWSFFGTYQIWDKKEGLYRLEKGRQVAIMSLKKPLGSVFIDGLRVPDSLKTYQILGDNYTQWLINSYWLAMPYKLKDKGTYLKYLGEDKTLDGKNADKLRFFMDTVGVMHHNMYDLWIDKNTGLLSQWAFYSTNKDTEPGYVRRWADYKVYNGVKIALDKGSFEDTVMISDVVLTNRMPKSLFLSAKQIDRSKIK